MSIFKNIKSLCDYLCANQEMVYRKWIRLIVEYIYICVPYLKLNMLSNKGTSTIYILQLEHVIVLGCMEEIWYRDALIIASFKITITTRYVQYNYYITEGP